MKDLFKQFEGLCRSFIVLGGSDRGIIVDQAGLRKKYLLRCQISSSKVILVRFHKVSFSIVKDLFKQFEGLCRSVMVLVCSDKGIFVDLAVLRKRYLIRCQISSSKVILVLFHKKSLSV